jgi:hypothetical protein
MKFASVVFVAAGVWGLIVLTPAFFLFDEVGRQHGSAVTYPQFFYGFLAVALAWQFAFVAIGSNPKRFRLMMLPSAVEKFGYVASMTTLFVQGRAPVIDALSAVPDLLLGVLFVVAFATTAPVPAIVEPSSRVSGKAA